ncbi:MAG: hypothetical protein NT038_05385 [Euryarchaeota archaeon]|nr:hypothetical protein [Euryarchaeota archaeon]
MDETPPVKKVEGTVKLKRLDPWSLAKIYAILGAIGGFIGGIFIAAIAAMASSIPGAATAGLGLWVGFGVLSVIIMPILCAIGGLIGGIIAAVLYNLVAGWVGGIEMKFE